MSATNTTVTRPKAGSIHPCSNTKVEIRYGGSRTTGEATTSGESTYTAQVIPTIKMGGVTLDILYCPLCGDPLNVG